jgi:hypothetical protein
MPTGKTIFAQLMDLIPSHRFKACVERYQGNKGTRRLSCWEQFLAMVFAQLTNRRSLRDLEVCLQALGAQRYRMGFRHPVARSTLAEANETRDFHIWQDLLDDLIEVTRPLYTGDTLGLEQVSELYALDCTVVDLCLSLFAWAQHRKNKSAVKIHTLLDVAASIPVFVQVTSGHVHEVAILDELVMVPGSFLVMDKGYTDFARLYRLAQIPVYFVLRAKRNLQYRRLRSRPVDRTTGLRSDQTIILTGTKTQRLYPRSLRRVHYQDFETGADLVFLTNSFQIPALTVAQLYRHRWQVEIFFKWIKQHLHIQAFYGTTPNAVKTQIFIAMTAFVLVARAQKLLELPHSPYLILQVLSLNLDKKVPLNQLLTKELFQLDTCTDPNQLCLFD